MPKALFGLGFGFAFLLVWILRAASRRSDAVFALEGLRVRGVLFFGDNKSGDFVAFWREVRKHLLSGKFEFCGFFLRCCCKVLFGEGVTLLSWLRLSEM